MSPSLSHSRTADEQAKFDAELAANEASASLAPKDPRATKTSRPPPPPSAGGQADSRRMSIGAAYDSDDDEAEAPLTKCWRLNAKGLLVVDTSGEQGTEVDDTVSEAGRTIAEEGADAAGPIPAKVGIGRRSTFLGKSIKRGLKSISMKKKPAVVVSDHTDEGLIASKMLMTTEQRVAVMELVKSGGMTVEQAMEYMVEQEAELAKKGFKPGVEDKINPLHELLGIMSQCSAEHLPKERQVQIMKEVRDGKLSIVTATAEAKRGLQKTKGRPARPSGAPLRAAPVRPPAKPTPAKPPSPTKGAPPKRPAPPPTRPPPPKKGGATTPTRPHPASLVPQPLDEPFVEATSEGRVAAEEPAVAVAAADSAEPAVEAAAEPAKTAEPEMGPAIVEPQAADSELVDAPATEASSPRAPIEEAVASQRAERKPALETGMVSEPAEPSSVGIPGATTTESTTDAAPPAPEAISEPQPEAPVEIEATAPDEAEPNAPAETSSPEEPVPEPEAPAQPSAAPVKKEPPPVATTKAAPPVAANQTAAAAPAPKPTPKTAEKPAEDPKEEPKTEVKLAPAPPKSEEEPKVEPKAEAKLAPAPAEREWPDEEPDEAPVATHNPDGSMTDAERERRYAEMMGGPADANAGKSKIWKALNPTRLKKDDTVGTVVMSSESMKGRRGLGGNAGGFSAASMGLDNADEDEDEEIDMGAAAAALDDASDMLAQLRAGEAAADAKFDDISESESEEDEYDSDGEFVLEEDDAITKMMEARRAKREQEDAERATLLKQKADESRAKEDARLQKERDEFAKVASAERAVAQKEKDALHAEAQTRLATELTFDFSFG